MSGHLEAFVEIGWALGSVVDIDALLPIIVDKTTQVIGADRSSLFLVDQARGEIWSKVLQGDELQEVRLPMGQGLVGHVIAAGEVLKIEDAYEDPRFDQAFDQRSGFRTRSVLCVPVRNRRQEVIGAIQVLNKHGGHGFSADDARLLEGIAAQAAIALENAALYQEALDRNRALLEAQATLRHKVAELDLLFDIERLVGHTASLEDLIRGLLTRTCGLTGVEVAAIGLLGAEDEVLDLHMLAGSGEALRRGRVSLGPGPLRRVLTEGHELIVNAPEREPKLFEEVEELMHVSLYGMVAVPIWSAGRPIGALALLGKPEGERFGNDEVKIGTLIAGQAGRSVQAMQDREARERQERLGLMGQMMSSLLHDLKSPMTVISGMAQLMTLVNDPIERAEHSDVILRQIEHVDLMVREILAFARGERSVLPQKIYLDKFIAEVRTLIEPELSAAGVALDLHDRFRGAAYFDPTKLKRVICNIARNAAQAMGEGGRFTWQIDTDPSDLLIMSFSDTGPGISPEMEGRLFEQFATHGKDEGSGLGLSIVKEIVEQHGGEVSYASLPGEGTTFTLSMPLKAAEQAKVWSKRA